MDGLSLSPYAPRTNGGNKEKFRKGMSQIKKSRIFKTNANASPLGNLDVVINSLTFAKHYVCCAYHMDVAGGITALCR